MKIAVAGTGYVGLSIAVLLAQNNEVVARDIVEAKVDMINRKLSPIADKEIEEYLRSKDLNLVATTDKERLMPAPSTSSSPPPPITTPISITLIPAASNR